MSTAHHVIVDGSNLATEGRSLPSLRQLDEAVRAYRDEDPTAEIIVVVDATFEHRIDAAERDDYLAAAEHSELLSPPAGAIGRGDAFILKIAERAKAVVLSNDSFQEFHGEHPWLFEEGRLIGGKPVPGIGWIFTPRTPVRGVKSRAATKKAATSGTKAPVAAAKLKVGLPDGTRPKVGDVLDVGAAPPAKKTTKRTAKKVAAPKQPVEAVSEIASSDPAPAKKAAKKKATVKKAAPAKKATTKPSRSDAPVEPDVVAPAPKKKVAKKQVAKKQPVEKSVPQVDPEPPQIRAPKVVNDALGFLHFVASHPIGGSVTGVVTSFTSHGAMVTVALEDGSSVECYAPVARLGNPPPAKAREVLTKGDTVTFTLAKLDPARRVAELSLP